MFASSLHKIDRTSDIRQWTKAEREGLLSDVRSILCKEEATWRSNEYYCILRWKMGKGYSQYTTLASRKAQWKKLVNEMTPAQQVEINNLSVESTEEAKDPELSHSMDPRKVGENEHVDDDEMFEAKDIRYDPLTFCKEKAQRDAFIADAMETQQDKLHDLSADEQWQFCFQLWQQQQYDEGDDDGNQTDYI